MASEKLTTYHKKWHCDSLAVSPFIESQNLAQINSKDYRSYHQSYLDFYHVPVHVHNLPILANCRKARKYLIDLSRAKCQLISDLNLPVTNNHLRLSPGRRCFTRLLRAKKETRITQLKKNLYLVK